jgi:hypothetical protein
MRMDVASASSRSHNSQAVTSPVVGRPAGSTAPKRDRKLTLTKIDKRGRLGKRVAELNTMFAGAVGGEQTPMRKLKVEQAAQLTALAELARGDFMRDGKGTLDDIVRCERKADQAVRALGISDVKPKTISPLAAHFAQPPKAVGA